MHLGTYAILIAARLRRNGARVAGYSIIAAPIISGFIIGLALRSWWALLYPVAVAVLFAVPMADPATENDLATSLGITLAFIAPMTALGGVARVSLGRVLVRRLRANE